MRRFGLTGAATGLSQMRKIAHRNPRMVLAIWGEAGLVVLMALTMTAAAVWVSVGVLPTLLPPGLLPAGWVTRTTVTAGVLTLASAGWFYLRGIGYAVTSESDGRGSLPRVAVPGLTPAARRELALNLYFHAALQRGSILAAVLPTILTGVADKGPSPVPTPGWASLLIVLLSAAFMGPVVYVFHRRLVFSRIANETCWLLDPQLAKNARSAGPPLFSLADPLRFLRSSLGRLTNYLASAACALDARQAAGNGPHPVSTLFRAAADDIRKFLRSERSWATDIPSDITELIQMIAVLIAMPADPASYQALAKRVGAFDSHGNPTTDPGQLPPGRFTTSASRATESIKGTADVIKAIGVVVVFAVSWALFATHAVNISYVGGHMP
jgi:hypothetical protein